MHVHIVKKGLQWYLYRLHTCKHTHTHARTHARTHTCTHTHTHTHTNTGHTYVHTHNKTYTWNIKSFTQEDNISASCGQHHATSSVDVHTPTSLQ